MDRNEIEVQISKKYSIRYLKVKCCQQKSETNRIEDQNNRGIERLSNSEPNKNKVTNNWTLFQYINALIGSHPLTKRKMMKRTLREAILLTVFSKINIFEIKLKILNSKVTQSLGVTFAQKYVFVLKQSHSFIPDISSYDMF